MKTELKELKKIVEDLKTRNNEIANEKIFSKICLNLQIPKIM